MGQTPQTPLIYRFKAMGSPCELRCFVTGKNAGKRVAEAVEADILRLEHRYSRYRPDSLLSNINQVAAVGGVVEIDDETLQLLNYADTCHQQSGGLFDITSGVLRHAWRFKDQQLPSQELIQELLQNVGWHKLELLQDPPRIRFNAPRMEIDLGGVVKEYAADRAAVICRNAGVRHGFINLGGDIRVIGPQPGGEPWTIGVQHPRRATGEVIGQLRLKHGGMATSGDYERCMLINGERYAHILNPKTGWPVKYLASVSVAANFCLIAGSAATIAMLLEQDGPAWLEQLGAPHLWMDIAGNVGGS